MKSFSSGVPTKNQAIGELVFACTLWGFGFVAAIWALRGLGPLQITGLRFLIAFGLSVLVCKFFEKTDFAKMLAPLWASRVPGLLIGLSILLQTWGLKYTSATKSALLTSMYVLFVPLFERLFFGKRLHRVYWLFLAGALYGLTLMTDLDFQRPQDWNRGDLLTLGCSFAATLQIIWFGRNSQNIQSAVLFNGCQCLWAGLPAFALAIFLEPWTGPVAREAWYGLGALTIGSTMIAFMLQVRAQKVLSSSFASALFLLEAPISAAFGYFILGETLKIPQWIGASLILFCILGALRTESSSAAA